VLKYVTISSLLLHGKLEVKSVASFLNNGNIPHKTYTPF